MDLNLLISTVITATAALIAIIGGFLISRVITLSSEQNGIRRKIREIELEIATKVQLFNTVSKSLLEEDQENFVSNNSSELITSKKDRGVFFEKWEDISKRWSHEDFKPVIEELNEIEKHLFSIFNQRQVTYKEDLPEVFEEFMDTLKSESLRGRQHWYELFYIPYRKQLKPKPKSETYNMFERMGLTSQTLNQNPTYGLTLPASYKNNESLNRSRIYGQKVNDYEIYERDLHFLRHQEAAQKKILKDYGYPDGMWGGLGVIVYASIVSIVYPVMLLPYPVATYNDELIKTWIISLFISQLIILLGYLGVNMYNLTRDEEDEKLRPLLYLKKIQSFLSLNLLKRHKKRISEIEK